MIKILYSNGCSMTEGSELGNLKYNFDEKWNGTSPSRNNVTPEHARHMEEHAYPNIVRTRLQIPEQLNGALCGSSNRRIVRTTITDVEKLCETYDPSEIFVLLGISGPDRFEFYSKDMGFTQIVPNSVFANNSRLRYHGKQNFKYFEARCEANDTLHELLASHFADLITITQYLEKRGVKFLFSYGTMVHFNGFSRGDKDRAIADPQIQALYKQIGFEDPKKWAVDVLRPVSLAEYLDDSSMFSFYTYVHKRKMHHGNGGHPLEHAHEAWGNHLAEYIKRNGILPAD